MQAVTCIANQRLWTLGGAASEAGHRSLGNQMTSRIGPYEGMLTISSPELTYDISRTDDGYQIRSSSKMNIELIQDKNGKNIICNSANSWQKVEFQIEISHASILEGKPAVKIIDPPKGQYELDIRTIE